MGKSEKRNKLSNIIVRTIKAYLWTN